MRIIRKPVRKTFSKVRNPVIRKKFNRKNFSHEFNEIWDTIIEHGVATGKECQLVCDINGWRKDSLNDIIFARTGYHDIEQYLGEDEEEEDDFACGSKGKKKFADSRDEIFEKVAYKELSEDEVKKLITKDELEEVQRQNCEYHHGNGEWESWVADIDLDDNWRLQAWYLQHKDDFFYQDGTPIEDLGDVDWKIDHYEIIER